MYAITLTEQSDHYGHPIWISYCLVLVLYPYKSVEDSLTLSDDPHKTIINTILQYTSQGCQVKVMVCKMGGTVNHVPSHPNNFSAPNLPLPG